MKPCGDQSIGTYGIVVDVVVEVVVCDVYVVEEVNEVVV